MGVLIHQMGTCRVTNRNWDSAKGSLQSILKLSSGFVSSP